MFVQITSSLILIAWLRKTGV